MQLFWDRENWQALCHDCHSRKTALEDGAFGAVTMLPSNLPHCSKPLVLVCGPPAAGKTTYVSEHAKAHDLVIDLDQMARAQYGAAIHELSKRQHAALISERNALLADYCSGRTKQRRCWLIATAGSFKHRKYWADHGAEIVVINPGAVVCKQRIHADTTRPPVVRAERAAAADRWR